MTIRNHSFLLHPLVDGLLPQVGIAETYGCVHSEWSFHSPSTSPPAVPGRRADDPCRPRSNADIENKASIRVPEKVGFKFEKFTTYRDHEVAWHVTEK